MKLKLRVLAAVVIGVSLAANAQLNNPDNLAFDGSGNLWVANYGANDVLELNPTSGAVLNTITNGVSGPTRLFLWPASFMF